MRVDKLTVCDSILDTCVATTTTRKDTCAGTDWKCLCDAWTTILTYV